jgi:hypothetical protein
LVVFVSRHFISRFELVALNIGDPKMAIASNRIAIEHEYYKILFDARNESDRDVLRIDSIHVRTVDGPNRHVLLLVAASGR